MALAFSDGVKDADMIGGLQGDRATLGEVEHDLVVHLGDGLDLPNLADLEISVEVRSSQS